MSSTLLMLSYAFPPENITGADRPFRFYRYLEEFGISPIVITASPQNREQPDIVFIRDEPRDFPRKNWFWHIERILRKFLLPGELGLSWSLKAANQACRLIASQSRKIVLSTSPPLSTHLAAFNIKRKLGIKWIADLRDPIGPSGEIFSRINIYPKLEKLIIKNADVVIANTDSFSGLLKHRYSTLKNKIQLLPNGFDPAEIILPAKDLHRNYKHIVHVGELYGGRNPGLILDSIHRLITSGALAHGSLRLSLIGPSSDCSIQNMYVLKKLLDAGVVEYIPTQVPKKQARLMNREADALLLIQPHSDTQVPAKLYEYIRIGRPVLAFLRRNSPSERILVRSGIPYRSIYPDDSQEEIDAKVMDFLTLSNKPSIASKWFEDNFNARHQTKKLASIIDSL